VARALVAAGNGMLHPLERPDAAPSLDTDLAGIDPLAERP